MKYEIRITQSENKSLVIYVDADDGAEAVNKGLDYIRDKLNGIGEITAVVKVGD